MTTLTDSSSATSASLQTLPLVLNAPPPVIAGEETALYDDLYARMVASVKPADPVEDMWVRDLADLGWEILRLRRVKATLLGISKCQGMTEVLRGLGEEYPAILARRWAARQPTAIGDVNERLSDAGLGVDAVMTGAMAARIAEYERVDRMLASAEGRRAATLCALEQRRDKNLAARLREAGRAIDREVEDAAFALVAPGDPA
jgi:hypothetical protein